MVCSIQFSIYSLGDFYYIKKFQRAFRKQFNLMKLVLSAILKYEVKIGSLVLRILIPCLFQLFEKQNRKKSYPELYYAIQNDKFSTHMLIFCSLTNLIFRKKLLQNCALSLLCMGCIRLLYKKEEEHYSLGSLFR